MSFIRSFEADMESKARVQKQQVEKTEQYQENELRQMSKRIRAEQVRPILRIYVFQIRATLITQD